MTGRIKIYERDLRGKTKMEWLDSKHTFSFGHFRDPNRLGFRSLRVINDDIVAPGSGFGTHPHANMEILTYVLEGSLEHKDSMGNGSVITAGDLQYMSAGSGVTHSEFNNDADKPVHLYQIWIRPNVRDSAPRYAQTSFSEQEKQSGFYLVADGTGTEGVISLRQDVRLFMAKPEEGETLEYNPAAGRGVFLQVLTGQVCLNGDMLKEGDGAEIEDVSEISITAQAKSELLLFDLA